MLLKSLKILAGASLILVFFGVRGGVSQTYAAKLYFFPQTVDVVVGESTIVELRLDTEGEVINAVEINGELQDKNVLLTNLSESNSLLKIFVEKPSIENNKFKVIGGVPGGFSGVGILARLNIQGVTMGNTALILNRNSRMLLNNENADQASVKFSDSSINVLQPGKDYVKVTSRTHPDQNRWYNSNKVNIHWDLESNAEYSYLVSRDPVGVPDDEADRPEGKLEWMGDIELAGLEDGSYYFSVKKVGTSSISRFLIRIDTEAPTSLNVVASLGTPETDEKDLISFQAEDVLSGINRYEVQLDDETPKVATSPYVTLKLYKKAVVRAYDEAGNVVEKEITRPAREESMALIGTVFTVGVLVTLFLLMRGRKKKSEDRS